MHVLFRLTLVGSCAWSHGFVGSQPRACSTNVMLAHAPGEAVNLEMAPDEIFPVAPRDGILVHANHWVSPAAQVKLRDTGIAISVCTLYRQRRTEDALRAKRREDLIEAWISYKRTKEVDTMRLRPHPYEFFLYYDI